MRTGQNIYKRRDGRWEARVPLGKKADGRPHFKYLYASTYREVLLQKNNYEKTISLKNTQVISNALFSDAAYNWLLNSARRWKPSTYIKYKNCLEKYILPQWKKYYVRDIQQGTYDRLMEFLQQELSGGSIRTINTIISGILKHTLNIFRSNVQERFLITQSDLWIFFQTGSPAGFLLIWKIATI